MEGNIPSDEGKVLMYLISGTKKQVKMKLATDVVGSVKRSGCFLVSSTMSLQTFRISLYDKVLVLDNKYEIVVRRGRLTEGTTLCYQSMHARIVLIFSSEAAKYYQQIQQK